MSLRAHNFKSIYKIKDDILTDFYIPALFNAKKYNRVSAYFSSDVLKLYAKGLSGFVNNEGKINFIFSQHISEEDYNAIKMGYDSRFDDLLMEKLSELSDCSSISNLAYLISQNIVNIKIGFVKPGTLHFKYGLIEDENDVVCFRGSTNETPAGLLLNGENFEVSCSWKASASEMEIIDEYRSDFEKLRNNKYEGVFTIEAPKCFISYFEKFNKNKLVLDFNDETDNSFVLDFNKDKKLVGYSFLNDKNLLSPYCFFFKTQMNFAVEEVINNTFYKFYDLKPSDLKSLINALKEHGIKHGYSVILSKKVSAYLDALDLELDKRQSLGLAIKNRHEIVDSEFEYFKNIVNLELERKLKEPQMWDAFHAAKMIASCNFSVPGTGKTTIAYGAFGYLSSNYVENPLKRVVMIGPKNSFMAWKNEFIKCFGNKRELKCLNIQDKSLFNENRRVLALLNEYEHSNLVLINYDLLQNPAILDTLKSLMAKSNFSDYLIYDEAHKIKAVNGKRASAAMQLSTFAKYKLILTGTPIPNSYVDIYNMLNFLFCADYDNFFGYTQDYLSRATYTKSYQEQINKSIYPFFCRTTKNDLMIPEATFDYDSCVIDIDEDEKHLFSLVYEYFGSNILVLYIRLLQASINPSSLLYNIKADDAMEIFGGFDYEDDDETHNYTSDTDYNFLKSQISTKENNNQITMSQEDFDFISNFGLTRKFYRGIDKIEEIVGNGRTVVAWGVFINTLQCIKSELEKRGIKAIVISGSMPLDEREKNIEKFINGEFDVLISNPHTLAESVSLHEVCHDAIYFEYTFNLTHFLQSRDRIHRLGISQGTKTNYYFAAFDSDDFFQSPIDMKTLERLKQKEERMITAVETKQLFIISESFEDDINYIFNK